MENRNINNLIRTFHSALENNFKRLQWNLEKLWQWKHCLRWVYQQFELIDGRENIFEKYFKLMLAIHRTDPATFEYIKFETDLFWKAETVGHFNENNLLTDTISSIEVDLRKLKRLLTK